jgi:hypothetical protein
MLSFTVISSSAPVSQNTHDAGGILRRASCSSASRSTQSSIIPRLLLQRAITPDHVTDQGNALVGRAAPWQAYPIPSSTSVPWPTPARLPPRNADFPVLHESGCFVIPTSNGNRALFKRTGLRRWRRPFGPAPFAGYADGAQSRDDVLAHFPQLDAAPTPLKPIRTVKTIPLASRRT